MTRVRATWSLAAASLLFALAGCGQGTTGSPEPPRPGAGVALPGDPDALVLQAAYVGGFVMPETTLARLPVVSIYADGRVLTEGPMAAIYPGFAWPNVLEQRIETDRVRELVAHALDAGIAEDQDLGMPPVADVPSTRFTVATADETFVREVYALIELPGDSGLTDEQEAGREQLRALFDELTSVVDMAGAAYEPDAVAAVVRPWTPAEPLEPGGEPLEPLEQPERAWPGPPLPGEPVGVELSCLTATGAQAAAVRAAAQDANVLTPWVAEDGSRWSVTFRPLLPHETGCADLQA